MIICKIDHTATYNAPDKYTVLIDDAPFCHTTDDDEGLKLQIAVAKLSLQKRIKP